MINIADVAKKAKVSKSTVSLVLNNNPLISETTRANVLAAIQELGYQPNISARHLRKGKRKNAVAGDRPRTGIIAFVVAKDIFCKCGHYDWNIARPLALAVQHASAHREVIAVYLYESLREGPLCLPVTDLQADGAVGQVIDLGVARFLQQHLPVVLFNSRFDPLQPVPTVNLDERAAMAHIVHHLAEIGHRRIGYFRPLARVENWQLILRWQAFTDAIAKYSMEVPLLFHQEWHISPATHEEVMQQFAAAVVPLVRSGEISAIVCPGDVYAFTLIKWLTNAGLRIPDDIAVTGFDDAPMPSGWTGPRLTTVRYPIEDMIRAAMEVLHCLIEKRISGVGEMLFPPHMVIGKSTVKCDSITSAHGAEERKNDEARDNSGNGDHLSVHQPYHC